MSKPFLTILIATSLFAAVFVPLNSCGPNIADAQVRQLISPWPEGTTLTGVINAICWNLFIFAAPLVVIMIAIGGYYYMFGGANPQRRSTGKKTLLWSIVGFLVLIFACVLPTMIRNIF